ncbi:MAG TPA: hypothetical protein VKB05_17340 [Pyrinomonadaceae bacterium]|nr:hypothetical protein [Pyrinomonadaceae bacterium]
MPKEAKKRSFFEQMFTASGRGTFNMVDFFDDMSHGNVDIGGSKVFGWFTLPHKWSDYKGSGANPQGRQDLINWAKQAATANGVDLSSFFNVVICMNATATQGTDLFGGGGGVVCDTNVLEASILGQEMGHGYGLDHSRLNGTLADYTDRWDVMSTWDSCFMQPHNDYVRIGPGLNAANMDGRGWLDGSRVWSPRSTSFSEFITLRPLHRRDLPGYLAARLGDYIVEFRKQDRWDAAIPRSAVLVHRFEDNHSYLMPATNGQQDLVANNTFGDNPGNTPFDIFASVTRLTVDEIDDTNQVATIHLEHRAPQVTAVGPGILFGGVAAGGDGFVIIGGKIIRIPPRSPLFRVLEQIALHEAAPVLSSALIGEELRREVFSSIAAIAEQQLQAVQMFSQPAPLQRR